MIEKERICFSTTIMAARRDKHKTPAFLEKANREQTKIQEKIHLKLQEDIYRLFQDGTYSDLALPCGPTPMLLHRAILETRVPGLLDIICPEGEPNKTILNSLAVEDLRQFIECVYQEDDLAKAWRMFLSHLAIPDKQEQKGEAVETGPAGDIQLHSGDDKEVGQALLGAYGGVASSEVNIRQKPSEVDEHLEGHTAVGKVESTEGRWIPDAIDEVSGDQMVAKELDPVPGESFGTAEVPQDQGERSRNTDRTSPSLPETDTDNTALVNGINHTESSLVNEQGTDTASVDVGRPDAGRVQHIDVCQYVCMDLPMGLVPKPLERMEPSATDTIQIGAASSGSQIVEQNSGRIRSMQENGLVTPNHHVSEIEVVNGVASLELDGLALQEIQGPDCNQLTKKSLLNSDFALTSEQESCDNQVDSNMGSLESPLHNCHVSNNNESHQIVARLRNLPVPSGTVSENLMHLLDTSIFSDVSLILTDGTRVPAHRFLLHCRSEFFAAMLGGGWIESESHEIQLKGMSVSVVDALLQFMYGGNAYLSDDANLRDLLGASDMYGLEGLKEITAFHLKRDWCHLFHKPLCTECLGLVPVCYALCESYGLPDLSQTCLRWMSKNIDRFWVQKTFASLPPEMLETCSKDVSEILTVKNVVEILFQLDKIKLSLPLGQSPWAEPAKEITSKTRKKVLQFACDYFRQILSSEFEDKYLKGMGWKVDVMEQLFGRVVAGLTLDNADVNFRALWQLYKKKTAEAEWNQEAYTAVGGFYDKVYNYIVSNASYIVHTEGFKTLPEELQKQIRNDAVYVDEGLSKTTTKKPVLSSSQRPKSGQVRRTLSHPIRASSPASSASSTSSTASAPSSSRSRGRGGGAGTGSGRGAVTGPSRSAGASSRSAGSSSRSVEASSRGAGASLRGAGASSRSVGTSSRSAEASSRGVGTSSTSGQRSSRTTGSSSRGTGSSSRASGDPSTSCAGPSRGSMGSYRATGSASRGTGSSSRGAGGPSMGSGVPSRGTGSRSAGATGGGDAVGRRAGTAARGNGTVRTRGRGVAGSEGAQDPGESPDS